MQATRTNCPTRPTGIVLRRRWDCEASRPIEVKDMKAGKVKGTKYLLELEPQDGAFVGAVTQAALPDPAAGPAG